MTRTSFVKWVGFGVSVVVLLGWWVWALARAVHALWRTWGEHD